MEQESLHSGDSPVAMDSGSLASAGNLPSAAGTTPSDKEQNEQYSIPPPVQTSLPKFFDTSRLDKSASSSSETTGNGAASPQHLLNPSHLEAGFDVNSGSESFDSSFKATSFRKSHSREDSVLSNVESVGGSSYNSGDTSDSHRRAHNFSIDERFQTRLSSLSSIIQNKPKIVERINTQSHSLDALIDPSSLSTPWEAIRWSKLRRLSSQLYSDIAISSYGRPCVIFPASYICVGTSRGLVLVFDYHQNLLHALGQHNHVSEFGSVTSIAISQDQTFVGAGYEDGTIVTWELSKPSSFNIKIRPVSRNYQEQPDTIGHLEGASIFNLAFVKRRHSSLISGDAQGMVFIHDTYRTILGRTPKSRLVLGRYPSNVRASSRKPTCIMGCSPSPVKSLEDLFIVAIMTPYYLVLVSPLPNPQTQYKVSRSSDADYSMGFSACLAWYPGSKDMSKNKSRTRLAYCWSNHLKILEVTQTRDTVTNDRKLSFSSKKAYFGDESIVDIEWISPKLLALVTVTQRLLIINEETMAVTAVVDLINKHVMHYDTFSSCLRGIQLPSRNTSDGPEPMIVAENFTNCIASFKGRLFLLGKYEFVLGTMSTWADRLMDVMDSGDQVRAIELATSFYLGEDDSVALGLSQNSEERQAVMLKTLPDLILNCLRVALKSSKPDSHDEPTIKELANASLSAVVAIRHFELLDSISEQFEAAKATSIFYERVSHFIYAGDIVSLPPRVFKEMVLNMSGNPEALEDVICRLDTSTLDIDLTLKLCKEHKLTETAVYVWNMALDDFIGPLMGFIEQINHDVQNNIGISLEGDRVYPYLSYILTGRVYPTGLTMEDEQKALKAKLACYNLIFFGTLQTYWTSDEKFCISQTSFPFLSLLIQYNAPAFFTALNEAFEDSFLNEIGDSIDNKDGNVIHRQLIITILSELLNSKQFAAESRIYYDIFVARNYSKFSQFIILPGAQLTIIMEDLCYLSSSENKEECEFALQSLFSKYRPSDLDSVISILYDKKYFSVLQYLFKTREKYQKYLEITFEMFFDQQKSANSRTHGEVGKIFSVISDCLNKTQAYMKEKAGVEKQLVDNFSLLVSWDSEKLVALVEKYAPKLHETVYRLENPELQLSYIREHFRLVFDLGGGKGNAPPMEERTLYISLLSKSHQTAELHRLVNTILPGESDIDLPSVVDDLIDSKCIDILVELLRRRGRNREAMIYLLDHLLYLDDDYTSAEISSSDGEQIETLLKYYTELGISLCQKSEGVVDELDESEQMWIKLLGTIAGMTKESSGTEIEDDGSETSSVNTFKEVDDLKISFKQQLLREALSSLLDTSTPKGINSSIQHNRLVVKIFRSLLDPGTSPGSHTIGSIRPIIQDIFEAYGYQKILLSVSKEILDHDSYECLLDLVSERLKGWKISKSGECEGCGQRIYGVGIDASWIYEQWSHKQTKTLAQRLTPSKITDIDRTAKSKGKAKEITADDTSKDILVVFKCGHTFHMSCLRRLGEEGHQSKVLHCLVCDN